MTRRKAPRGLAQVAYEAHYSYPGALPWNCAQLATRRVWKRTARAVAREVRKRMSTQPAPDQRPAFLSACARVGEAIRTKL